MNQFVVNKLVKEKRKIITAKRNMQTYRRETSHIYFFFFIKTNMYISIKISKTVQLVTKRFLCIFIITIFDDIPVLACLVIFIFLNSS